MSTSATALEPASGTVDLDKLTIEEVYYILRVDTCGVGDGINRQMLLIERDIKLSYDAYIIAALGFCDSDRVR